MVGACQAWAVLTVALAAAMVLARRFSVVAVLLKLIGAFSVRVSLAVRVAAPVAPLWRVRPVMNTARQINHVLLQVY